MSQVEIEREISNSIFHHNLEFFQCKIWVSLRLLKKSQVAKVKAEGLAATIMLEAQGQG